MKNKNLWISIGIFVFIILVTFIWISSSYNGLVGADETINEKWANVQTAYQRRADLIPNLVSVVQKYTDYESSVLTKVTKLRAQVGSSQNPSELNNVNEQLEGEISKLLVVVENYPELKANEQFLSLQDELAGTENRIKTERDIYNGAVKNLNLKVRRFPSNIVAGWFGFSQREMFKADNGSQNAPNVKDLLN